MHPGTDVMDNRTEIWMPLGLNPGNRQNRGSHPDFRALLLGRIAHVSAVHRERGGKLRGLFDRIDWSAGSSTGPAD